MLLSRSWSESGAIKLSRVKIYLVPFSIIAPTPPHHIQLLQLSTHSHLGISSRCAGLVWVAAAPGANHGEVTRHVSGVRRCSGWRIRYSHCRNHLPAWSQIYKWRQHHKCAYSTKLAAQNFDVCPSFDLRSLANKTSKLLKCKSHSFCLHCVALSFTNIVKHRWHVCGDWYWPGHGNDAGRQSAGHGSAPGHDCAGWKPELDWRHWRWRWWDRARDQGQMAPPSASPLTTSQGWPILGCTRIITS